MLEAFFSGAWRTAKRAEIQIGGSWRRITRAEVYRGGQWRSALSFAQPLTVTAYDVYASRSNRGKPTPVDGSSTCTPIGGVGPFTYQWTVTSGGAAVYSPTNATATFSEVLTAGETSYSTASVTCTDSFGTSAFADIAITLTNEGF